MTLYESIVEAVPQIARGLVWCKACGRSMRIDGGDALRDGWPKCHGYTMTIDHPSTWGGKG